MRVESNNEKNKASEHLKDAKKQPEIRDTNGSKFVSGDRVLPFSKKDEKK